MDRLRRRKIISRVLLITWLLVGIGIYVGWGNPDLLDAIVGGLLAGGIVLGLAFGAEQISKRHRSS